MVSRDLIEKSFPVCGQSRNAKPEDINFFKLNKKDYYKTFTNVRPLIIYAEKRGNTVNQFSKLNKRSKKN